ncbi:MAG: CBS domain-containing protein [Bacilli bacterium]
MNIINFLKPKKEIVFIYSDFTIRQALEKMHIHRFTAIPIINQEGGYVGTITEGDLLWFIKENAFLDLKKAENLPVMSVPRKRDNRPVYISAHIEELYRLSLEQNFIPVLDDRAMFIGIVTRSDLLNFFQEKPQANSESPYDAILGRRSIRSWQTFPVQEDLIEKIIIAGLAAPSARNKRPIHIVRISDKKLQKEILEQKPYMLKLNAAPESFAIFGDMSVEENEFLLNNNASATIENMLLAIHALGLGGVWIGAASAEWRDFVAKKLQMPENFMLFGMIAYGHPNEKKAPYLSADPEKWHLNQFGKK